MLRWLISAAFLTVSALPAWAELPADPFKSVMWGTLAKDFFGDAPVVLDDNVKIILPSITENQAQVPVTADARAVRGVVRMVVFADFNPIQHVLTLTPNDSAAYIAFRMKVEQATPVRAAVLTEDGTWHVGGSYLDAAGGGCSAPALARNDADWSETVGQSQGRLWREVDGTTRARFRVRHPMDTGLTKDNTPAFYIERVDVRSSDGAPLATIEASEPLAEDPTLTLIVRLPSAAHELDIESRDNNGGTYRSSLPAPWRQSALETCSLGAAC